MITLNTFASITVKNIFKCHLQFIFQIIYSPWLKKILSFDALICTKIKDYQWFLPLDMITMVDEKLKYRVFFYCVVDKNCHKIRSFDAVVMTFSGLALSKLCIWKILEWILVVTQQKICSSFVLEPLSPDFGQTLLIVPWLSMLNFSVESLADVLKLFKRFVSRLN